MSFPLVRMYRLAPRGGDGLACDAAGVALGSADLARVGADAAGRRENDLLVEHVCRAVLAYG